MASKLSVGGLAYSAISERLRAHVAPGAARAVRVWRR
jgi:hypothetical protein